MTSQAFPLAQALQLGCLDAHDQSALVRRGELSPRELTAAGIVRIQAAQLQRLGQGKSLRGHALESWTCRRARRWP